ncbi:ATP-binding cassette domain-containing protein [Salinispora tropica]|uniref:ABC transporter related n=1 Tax=Salinispora tropica (strain ATCC BAA-916 / DSM 44818 / JCM 13857 / NBRC 105044 / CNB-440) TaxID=369723 RepID=A4X4M4_SALTO|nr:ATP-binding cassette domain-containing protein [Salinispora tropica]ABP53824.1 ABC transporter related [Salinispora tropica CNB-440]
MRLLRDLWATAPRRMTAVAILVLLGAGGQAAAAALAGPVLVHRSVGAFVLLAAALVAAVVSGLVVNLVLAGVTADWSAAVRRRLCRVAFGQDLPTLEATPVGELLDRIDGDVYQVAAGLRSQGIRIVQMLTAGLLSAVVALGVWWPGGLTMLLLAGALVVVLRGPTARIVPARMAEEAAWSDLAAVMEEAVHGQDDVRTSLAQPYVLRLWATRAAAVLSRARPVWRMSARVTTTAVGVTSVGIAAVVLVGAWALASGRVDGARLTAVWLLAIAFGVTIEHVSQLVPEIQFALGAWGRVRLLADCPQERVGGLAPVDGDLTVRGLTFQYPVADGARGPALRDIHLTFIRGRSYAVVGRTGSGKSTLAKVLTRAVEVPAGTVLLGGRDLRDIDVEKLRRWVAVVPQRTEILAGTLAENIALFDPDLLDAAADALRELGLDSWVTELPDGLRTRLGEGGHVLSAGQEQLVAFARILVRDPHVVILDEATARLDPVTEARVQAATERLLRDRIGLVIAHRLSSVRHCDEVVVLADGAVLEAGPLRESGRFAELLATSHAATSDAVTPVSTSAPTPAQVGVGGGGPGRASGSGVGGGVGLLDGPEPDARPDLGPAAAPAKPTSPVAVDVRPPMVAEECRPPAEGALPPTGGASTPTGGASPPPVASLGRTLREIWRLLRNDPRYGLAALVPFIVLVLVGLAGPVLPWLWADVVDGVREPWLPALGIAAGLLAMLPFHWYSTLWFQGWWVRQMLRINLRLVHGQTGPRRVGGYTPAEVVAQGGDTERVVELADNALDQFVGLALLVTMTVISGSVVPGLFFVGTMVASALVATSFGPALERSARATVTARAAYATALVSGLSAARTVKLAGATGPVLDHLADLDATRSQRQRREISTQVWSRSTPSLVSGLLPIGAWGLFLAGVLSAGATLVAVSTLVTARWIAWTAASLLSQVPSARVWTQRTVAMTGAPAYSAALPGVDPAAGTAPAPSAPARHPLHRLELAGFGVRHSDGVAAVRDVDLTLERGQLVLVVGPVGSGKSSLLRALAGIVPYTGRLMWNGVPVTEPELFLRPHQVGYVGQQPRVLSGTVADNITLDHPVGADAAVSTAQLEPDLAASGAGLGLAIGHKGTRLSGGQLQRLALARALAPRSELLVADDVSSALDVTTELALWAALRQHGVTVLGSTSKRAALLRADHVLVLRDGRVAAQGRWCELAAQWSHLAG